jgi:hypothetical protein
MTNAEDKAIDEALEVITEGKQEQIDTKTVLYDKKNSQYSIKIPKSLALKARLNEKSEFKIIVNPKDETIKNIKTNIVIFKEYAENGEGEKST